MLSEALAGVGVWLAREAANDAIHKAAPAWAVEGEQVRPDRRRSQRAVFHARSQDCRCKGFPLHETDGTRGHGEPDSKVEPADAGAEGEGA